MAAHATIPARNRLDGSNPFTSAGFLLPALLFFLGWQIYPIIRVLWLSFTDYHFLRPDSTPKFVGFANYSQALRDPLVYGGLWRATVFTAVFLPGMIFIPMMAAIFIDRVKNARLATAYRIVLLIPSMIPGPLIFVLWKWLYSYNIGPINYFLVDVFGLVDLQHAPQWLGDPRLTLISLAVMEWWWGLGYHTMFFLAGLGAIPKELYEAASVDGAGEWSKFWNVTFPSLRPILLVLIVLRFGSAMALVDEYLIMGGFNRTLPTYTWTVYMWEVAFHLNDWNQGFAAAIGWLGAICMLFVVGILFWLFRPR